MKKQPIQTAKTRQTMIDAFWELAAIQGIDKVTISGITKKAGLNRSTFYVYFTDITDLLIQAENDIITELQERMKTAIIEGGFDNFEIISKKMVDVFALYDDKLFMLIGKNGDPNFRAIVIDAATKMFREVFKPLENAQNSEYITAYLTSAFMGALSYWHESGKRISIMELAKILHSLATKGLNGVIDKDVVKCLLK